MPTYEYRGLNTTGKNVRGTYEAENLRMARAKLKKDGIYLVDIKDKTKTVKGQKRKKISAQHKVGVTELAQMTRQLATLLKANIPLVECLAAVTEQTEQQLLKEALSDIKTMVNEGSSLNKALRKYPKIFDRTFISMCEAGETSGTLDVILLRLAEFTESQHALLSKVKSASLYPILMMVFTMVVLAVLFVAVIPKMVDIFESSPQLVLPWNTLVVINISSFLVNYWFVVIMAGVGGVTIFINWKNSPKGEPQWDAILLKLPLIGQLSRMIAVSRFTRTLATLLTGGVPMLNAMDIVRNVVNNAVLAEAIDNARENISEGESVAGPLKKSGQFPPIVTHMINIGERTGELEPMLTQVSEAYDFQVKTRIEGLTALLEPIMLLVMGCIIAFIVFSIMLPLFEMSNIAE